MGSHGTEKAARLSQTSSSASSNIVGLVAILLVSRSRPGPKLVFHYPPNPHLTQSKENAALDESESDSDDDAEGLAQILTSKVEATTSVDGKQRSAAASEDAATSETLFGFQEDSLVKILCPDCRWDRTRFEVSIDGLTYLGHPAFADNDGSWTRRHNHLNNGPHLADSGTAERPDPKKEREQDESESSPFALAVTGPQTPIKPADDFTHVPESFDSRLGVSLATSANSESTTSTIAADPLAMFHLVFVIEPTSGPDDVSAFFSHVVKKLTAALVYCQKQASYVGVESRKLLALRTKARQEYRNAASMCAEMVENSELAWALKEVYEQVSSGSIAGIRLSGREMSLPVPLQKHSIGDEAEFGPRCALILLEEKEGLLRALAHPDASPLAYFIREHTPTKSLQKLSTRLGMTIDEVLYLSRHLIKWRKARPEMPLHPRNFYVVGPHAPVGRLADFIPTYAQRFSALPSLPQMLRALSGKPVKYGMLIPSRDHRPSYMDILAFLVRHHFVLRIKTRGWLRAISPHHSMSEEHSVNQNRLPLSVSSLLSPQLRPVDDDAGSVSSERTAIPASEVTALKQRIGRTTVETTQDQEEVERLRLILNPLHPSEEEERCLNFIGEASKDGELSDRFPALMQYFDGNSILEDVAAMEGLKRSKLEAWLDHLQRNGLLWTFKSV